MFYLEKMKSYKEFCSNTSSYISQGGNYHSYRDKYLNSYEIAFLLSSPNVKNKMLALKKYLNSKMGEAMSIEDKNHAESLLADINKAMSNELKSYK
jgi:hypothetical protein